MSENQNTGEEMKKICDQAETSTEMKLPRELHQNTTGRKNQLSSRAKLTKNAVLSHNQAEVRIKTKIPREQQPKASSLSQMKGKSDKEKETKNANENTPDRRRSIVRHQKARRKLTFS